MSKPDTFTFEVVPADPDGDTFEPFVVDVPTLSGIEVAARRAYFAAFHNLGPRGIEPEEFTVHVYMPGRPHDLVGPGGIVAI